MVLFLILVLLGFVIVFIILAMKNSRRDVELERLKLSLEQALLSREQHGRDIEELTNTRASLRKECSRNKSVEVRTGLIMEKMAPFLEAFNYDPKSAQFLGQPIDFIVFGEEEIVLIEVKTGKARTTKKQSAIKKLVKDGKVRFEVVRFDYE